MVENIITKPLGLVLIFTVQMVFNDPSRAEVTGILGNNITLQFTFNVTVTKNSHVAIYITDHKKIVECSPGKNCSGGGVFNVFLGNFSVFCRISNLKLNQSKTYWASLFMDSGPARESNKVQLVVREENRSSTVFPMPTNSTATKNKRSYSVSYFPIVTVLVVSSVVLLAAVLPWIIWCLVRTKDNQQHQSSNPTVQETVEASNNAPAPSLIYSVLEFTKRPSTVSEINPNDTEYAAVSYTSDKSVIYG